MEKQPKPDKLRFQFGEHEIFAERDNSCLYIHPKKQQMYDHIFIELEDDPEIEGQGMYIFRRHLENFDEAIKWYKEKGWRIMSGPVTELDKEFYDSRWGTENALESCETQKTCSEPSLEYRELTARQERRIEWLRYLLENNKLDFGQEGEVSL